MESSDQEMVQITLNGETFTVNKLFYHFIELQKLRKQTFSTLSTLINEFSDFMAYWEEFQKSKEDPHYENKHLEKFQLFHTIKPGTQYAYQQEEVKGKFVPYPVTSFGKDRLYSMACGGNYPIEDCLIYVRQNGQYIKVN